MTTPNDFNFDKFDLQFSRQLLHHIRTETSYVELVVLNGVGQSALALDGNGDQNDNKYLWFDIRGHMGQFTMVDLNTFTADVFHRLISNFIVVNIIIFENKVSKSEIKEILVSSPKVETLKQRLKHLNATSFFVDIEHSSYSVIDL
jgi:hypothetical protein